MTSKRLISILVNLLDELEQIMGGGGVGVLVFVKINIFCYEKKSFHVFFTFYAMSNILEYKKEKIIHFCSHFYAISNKKVFWENIEKCP